MGQPVELMCQYWTTSGVFPGDGDISRFEFRDRVAAAAKVGFKGIGLWHTDLEHVMAHQSLGEMKSILDDHGMRYLELEFLTDWFVDGARRGESDSWKKRLFASSQALGAKHIKVGDFSNTPCPRGRVAEAFAGLCQEAATFGGRIGFEFMRSAFTGSFKDALLMVEEAGAPNGGLILDIVHVMNLGIRAEELRRIPPRYLVNVEANDGTLPGSPRHDPARERRWCGEGEYDITGFIRCLRDAGYAGPWGVEVFSRELAALPLHELAERAYTTTMAQFHPEETFRGGFTRRPRRFFSTPA